MPPLESGGLGIQMAADRAAAARWAGLVGALPAANRALGCDAMDTALQDPVTRYGLQSLANRLAQACPSATMLNMVLDGALRQEIKQSACFVRASPSPVRKGGRHLGTRRVS